jgi:hypothetical protein
MLHYSTVTNVLITHYRTVQHDKKVHGTKRSILYTTVHYTTVHRYSNKTALYRKQYFCFNQLNNRLIRCLPDLHNLISCSITLTRYESTKQLIKYVDVCLT